MRENFDFFNYAGLHRPVKIYTTPKQYIKDIIITHEVNGADAKVNVEVKKEGDLKVRVKLLKQCGEEIGQADGEKVTLDVKSVNLWQPLNAYHYTARVQLLDGDKVVDEYNEEFGIRTVEVKDAKFLINGEPFYFKRLW